VHAQLGGARKKQDRGFTSSWATTARISTHPKGVANHDEFVARSSLAEAAQSGTATLISLECRGVGEELGPDTGRVKAPGQQQHR